MSPPDAVTLAVVAGALDSAVREMTVTLRRAAMSPVLAIGNDFSNAIFDSTPRMVHQGQDQPVHLGAMIFATKGVSHYFDDDLHEGDIIYHNDPLTGGSHLQDMTMYKPVFYENKLVFWVVNRSHMDETGGPRAGGYNPLAEEIWAEGLRISPVRIYHKGKRRQDVIDLMATNFRTRRQWLGDLGAQIAAVNMAEGRLLSLLDRYGVETVTACTEALLNRAEKLMKEEVRAMPDGEYMGRDRIEDDGHGSGDMELGVTVRIAGEEMHIAIDAPPQARSYINSYSANTMGGIYLGVMTYLDPNIPHNEGLYRPITVDLGPEGTLANPVEPAACGMCTSVPYGHLAQAVRDALGKAVPERAGGGWAKVCIEVLTGTDPRNDEHYAFLPVMTGWGGGGAFWGYDGEPCVGCIEVAGAAMTGDVETVEHMVPMHIHRYELDPDSACPGRWRGGWGPVMEVSPVDHTSKVSTIGDGMKFSPPSVLGGGSPVGKERVFHKYILGPEGRQSIALHTVNDVREDQYMEIHCAGGGGVGNPFERDVNAVFEDVRGGLVSIGCARGEYGVVFDPTDFSIDEEATASLRNNFLEVL